MPSLSRRILALAIPALGALVAQPLFVATDTAMVGHLGQRVLAGQAIGATVITTVVGLMVFLAYTTTPQVARRLGAGDRPGAIRAGIDGMWLGLGIGIALLLVGLPLTAPVVSLFTQDTDVASAAHSFLSISLWGLPGMLTTLAATGLLRGLQDTRTPLVVAITGAVANAGLNAVLIFGVHLGVAGSALGTAITETGMAVVYLFIARQAAAAHGVSLAPGIGHPRRALAASGLMMLRTATLRASLLVLIWAAARLGVPELAALQVTMSVFTVLLFVLDALAIAAQALVGHDLGVGDLAAVRRLSRMLMLWGLAAGAVLGVAMALAAGPVAILFTSDATVLTLLPGVLVTMAATLPLSGFVFALDGVLIGAHDLAFLAWIGLAHFAVFAASVWGVLTLADTGGAGPQLGLNLLWLCFGGTMMLARAVTLGYRVAGQRWLQVGAAA